MSFKDIRFGTCEWVFPTPLRGPSCCKVLKDFGMDVIEIEVGSAEEGFPLHDPYTLNAYREAKEKYGVDFAGVAANHTLDYSMNLTNPDKECRDTIMKGAFYAIDAAAALDAPLIHLPSYTESLIKTEEDLISTAGYFREFCDYAADKNVLVCTENALNIEDQKKMFELVDRDNFKLYFDCENYQIEGLYTPDLAEEFFDYVPQIHVKDGYVDFGTHLLGEGGAHVYETMKVFSRKGYSGYMLLENLYWQKPLLTEGKNPFEMMKRDLDVLKGWVAEL